MGDQRELAFCPECESYSLIDRDGPIPHTGDCSEPEYLVFVPESSLARVREERDELKRIIDFDQHIPLAELREDAARYREALEVAADDLAKAANQFAGMPGNVNNADIFTAKSERARAVLASPQPTG